MLKFEDGWDTIKLDVLKDDVLRKRMVEEQQRILREIEDKIRAATKAVTDIEAGESYKKLVEGQQKAAQGGKFQAKGKLKQVEQEHLSATSTLTQLEKYKTSRGESFNQKVLEVANVTADQLRTEAEVAGGKTLSKGEVSSRIMAICNELKRINDPIATEWQKNHIQAAFVDAAQRYKQSAVAAAVVAAAVNGSDTTQVVTVTQGVHQRADLHFTVKTSGLDSAVKGNDSTLTDTEITGTLSKQIHLNVEPVTVDSTKSIKITKISWMAGAGTGEKKVAFPSS